eukprot:5566025-Amphidinium_carterae.2
MHQYYNRSQWHILSSLHSMCDEKLKRRPYMSRWQTWSKLEHSERRSKFFGATDVEGCLSHQTCNESAVSCAEGSGQSSTE